MSLLARFKFFIIGIFLGSILVFFFFGDKVKKWFFFYSSSGRVVSHLIEPRYTLIHDQDTIDFLSVQGVFYVLENQSNKFDIDLLPFDSLNKLEDPIAYIQENIDQIKDGSLIIQQKNIFYTNQVFNKLDLDDSLVHSYNIIDSLIETSQVEVLSRGDCYKYSLKNNYFNQDLDFIFESCDSIVKLIDLK